MRYRVEGSWHFSLILEVAIAKVVIRFSLESVMDQING